MNPNSLLRRFFSSRKQLGKPAPQMLPEAIVALREELRGQSIGLIAGNGAFPHTFIREAKQYQCQVIAACHELETSPEIADAADVSTWVKVGELGKMIKFFKEQGVRHVAMAGGISRVKLFGNVKLDSRGAAMIFRIGSMKDDNVMRGIAEEFEKDSISVVPCTIFLTEQLVSLGVLSKREPTKSEYEDIEIGRRALRAMSSEHIGQTVVVRDGVVVAVEAVEGTDRCILRGGELGKAGTVVVKCAKTGQDMRFDVPTVGLTTIETMVTVGASVLALEAERTLMLEPEQLLKTAATNGIAVVGLPALSTS